MQTKTNLELKYFCNDFGPIRKILRKLGASKVGIKKQVDYFYNLPPSESLHNRLKLRTEGREKTLIYYQRPDFSGEKATSANVSLLEVKDKNLLRFLQKILGVKAIVVKQRELWKKENTIFNLDTVKDIGKIFEIEVTVNNVTKDKGTFNYYKNKFLPYLGKIVRGSNLDLAHSESTLII